MTFATTRSRIAVAAAALALVAPGTRLLAQTGTQQPAPPAHHSKVKGAVVGAAAGHMLGHHAKAGAVTGALIQHHRNHKAAKAAATAPASH